MTPEMDHVVVFNIAEIEKPDFQELNGAWHSTVAKERTKLHAPHSDRQQPAWLQHGAGASLCIGGKPPTVSVIDVRARRRVRLTPNRAPPSSPSCN
jgi:hypothetical protein